MCIRDRLGIDSTSVKVSTPERVKIGEQPSYGDDALSQAGYMSNIVDIAIGGLTNDAMFALFVEDGGVVYGSGNNA